MSIRSNYYIPGPMIVRLKRMAKKRDLSISEIVRRAIEDYLKREEKKKK